MQGIVRRGTGNDGKAYLTGLMRESGQIGAEETPHLEELIRAAGLATLAEKTPFCTDIPEPQLPAGRMYEAIHDSLAFDWHCLAGRFPERD